MSQCWRFLSATADGHDRVVGAVGCRGKQREILVFAPHIKRIGAADDIGQKRYVYISCLSFRSLRPPGAAMR